ncbi:MMPL family transporter [Kineosporia babensis]|uniref:MMPL family transporter n=1 Tax=Kineosporia babensis TaxID=499548 RepID=A0A9X1SW24_9ACTN|nr:MMPL family transporter [Kineosporia babensis]MCD5314306.1 MMPL family transporter [Kineosporia babensis]
MDQIAKFVLKHRWWVIAFWVAALIGGGLSAGRVADQLSADFALPGQEGSDTQAELAESYGISSELGYLPVYTGEITKKSVAAVADQIRAEGVQVIDYASTGDKAFLTDDGRSTYMLVYGPEGNGFGGSAENVETALVEAGEANGFEVGVTGMNQLSEGNTATGAEEEGSILTETLLGALGALVVLLFVFASFLAFVPLVIAAVSILSSFLAVLAMTAVTDVSFIVEFLIALIGLGVAIDYSLLVVTRWREERNRGVANDEAVTTAIRTAGHAVYASGVTVAISLCALVVVNVPAVRSMGLGGMVIPLISTLVVLTLLPALLSLIGPRMDWPRLRKENHIAKGWAAWTRGVIRFRWIAAVTGLAALAVAVIPAFGVQIGQPGADSLATKGEAAETLHSLRDNGIADGVLTPMIMLLEPGTDAAAFVEKAESVDGVRSATAVAPAENGITEVVVVPVRETVDSTSIQTVTDVREAVKDEPGYIGITGLGAGALDWQNAVYKIFPFVLVLIAAVVFVLLMREFRSILLPLKAVLFNLISVAAVFGITVFFWQQGHGSEALFDIQATGAITFWLPVMIFAFLFGLSMDYEVFILARMREEYDRTGSTNYAVEHGLGRTGRLVTSAALILFFAFASLAQTPQTDIKVLATALGAGILLDATLVRALLVPAVVSILGKYNWWLPAPVAKILRVEPSPLRPDVQLPPGFDLDDPEPEQTERVPSLEH